MDVNPNERLDERAARLKRLNVQRVQRCRARKHVGARCVRIEVTDWQAHQRGPERRQSAFYLDCHEEKPTEC